MEDHATTPEDLSPLKLRELRSLDLAEPPAKGMAPRVVSASGVVRRGDYVYVIGDDMLQLAVFEIAVGEFPKRNACDLEDFGGILLLGLAQNYQFLLRNVGVGCAIAAVGEDNVVYFGAGTYELGDGTAG